MASYLIDSDILIDYLNGRSLAVSLLQQFAQRNDLLSISPISVTEVFAGTAPAGHGLTEKFLKSFQLELPDFEIARHAGEYLFNFKKKGITLALSDTTIAATAKIKNLILVTRNLKHYPMKDIVVYAG